jgi:hypothetical protein
VGGFFVASPGARKQGACIMRFFEGFPYIVTKVVGAMHHMILLPGGLPDNNLLEITRWQAAANKLQTSLVLRDPDAVISSRAAPSRHLTLYARRDFREGFLATLRRVRRVGRVRRPGNTSQQFISSLAMSGCILGELTKSGPEATSAEVRKPAGRKPEGVPKGLKKCAKSCYWTGEWALQRVTMDEEISGGLQPAAGRRGGEPKDSGSIFDTEQQFGRAEHKGVRWYDGLKGA